TWPTWKQVRATTTVVIASIFGFAAYFGVVDMAVGKLIEKIFATLAK
ncbi:MAG: preprotein translocase subunit SecE, partial [Bryobacteraceae bacterium]|nr:preprotein translocase subunit SecE [Bryobacteraceae bacterium]